MNEKKTDIATTHMCKHHFFNAELVDDQHSCTISCSSMTSFNSAPENDPSILSSSPPLFYPGDNRSQISISDDDANILMMPMLLSLEEDEWNRKNSTRPPQTHLKERFKMTPRFHPEDQFPFVSTCPSNMTMAPIPSKMNTTPMRSKDEAHHYSCSRNESPFSTAYFRPIQFNNAQDSYQIT